MNLKAKLPALVAILAAAPAWAFKLEPMSLTLRPSGAGALQRLRVVNPGAEPVTVQVQGFRREFDSDGKETRTPAPELALSAARLELGPHETRDVAVRWKGEPHPPRELAFGVIVAEQPAENTSPHKRQVGVNLSFLVQYMANVYITPPGSRARVVVDSFKVLPDGKGELIVSNPGNAHRGLRSVALELRRPVEGKRPIRYAVASDSLEQLRSAVLLPGNTRRFLLLLPGALSGYNGPLSAELSFGPP